jgi:hypothetical protein
MPWVVEDNVGIQSVQHPYHQIIPGNWLKTADIAKNFTRFEPYTNPMPGQVVDGNVGIEYLAWHRVLNAILTIKLFHH